MRMAYINMADRTHKCPHSWFSDKLWDGKGCAAGNSCCANADSLWFCRTLSHEVNESIEVRLCRDKGPAIRVLLMKTSE